MIPISFKTFLEADKEDLDPILGFWDRKGGITPQNLPFKNLFNTEYRLAQPITYSPNFAKISNLLRQIGYQEIDWKKGVANYSIYQKDRSPKVGSTNISKALSKTNASPEEIQNLQRWVSLLYTYDVPRETSDKEKEEIKKQHYNQISQQAKASLNKNQLSVIISRHPIDIVRMSDFEPGYTVDSGSPEIHSCHGFGESHCKAASLEAKYGGAIAYLVKTEDLKNIDTKEDEILRDKSRNLPGVKPLARLRLRRFTSKDKSIDILLPDLKVYGDDAVANSVDFKGWVINWAKETQKNIINEIKKRKLTLQDFVLRGGYYQDHGNDSNLWERIIGPATGDAGGYGFKDEEIQDQDYIDSNRYEIFADEMRTFHNQFNSTNGLFKHYSLIRTNYSIDQEDPFGEVIMLSWNADIKIVLPESSFSQQLIKYLSPPFRENETQQDRKSRLQLRLDSLEIKDLQKQIERISNLNVKNFIIKYYAGGWVQQQQGSLGSISFEFDIFQEKDGDYYEDENNNPDAYKEFLQDIKSVFDDNYEQFQKITQNWLSKKEVRGIGKVVNAPLSLKFAQTQDKRNELESKDLTDEVKRSLKYFYSEVKHPDDIENVAHPIFSAKAMATIDFETPQSQQIKKQFGPVDELLKKHINSYLIPETNKILLQVLNSTPQSQLQFWTKKIKPKQTNWIFPDVKWNFFESSLNQFKITIYCDISFNVFINDDKQTLQNKYLTLLALDKQWPTTRQKIEQLADKFVRQQIKNLTGQPWHKGDDYKTPTFMDIYRKNKLPLFP